MDQMYSMICDCLKPRNREGDEPTPEVSMSKEPSYRGLSASEELEVTCLDSASGNQIVCGDASGKLIAFDFCKGSVTQRWEGHSKSVTKVCTQRGTAGGDTRILTSSRDLSLRLWSLGADKACQQEFKGHHELVVSAAAFSPDDSNVICSGSRDNGIALWDIQTGKVTVSCKIARNLVTDVCWKGSLLAQTSEDKTLRLWDAHNMQVAQTFALKHQILTGCDIYGTQIATTSGGFNGTGCEVTLWDNRNGTLPLHEFKGHTEKVHRCCYTGSEDGTVYLPFK